VAAVTSVAGAQVAHQQVTATEYIQSGSRSTLRCLRPLRTVRASFPAYGSSLYKAPD
jgi:hypothetical protein